MSTPALISSETDAEKIARLERQNGELRFELFDAGLYIDSLERQLDVLNRHRNHLLKARSARLALARHSHPLTTHQP